MKAQRTSSKTALREQKVLLLGDNFNSPVVIFVPAASVGSPFPCYQLLPPPKKMGNLGRRFGMTLQSFLCKYEKEVCSAKHCGCTIDLNWVLTCTW